MTALIARTAVLVAATLVAACAPRPQGVAVKDAPLTPPRVTHHAGTDDLLTAGLGLAGLRAIAPPAYANPDAPTPAEVRRRAIWANWRGIADLAPGGGYGDVYGSLPDVPGREFSAFMTVPGAHAPHRVLLQLPDAFDTQRRCVIVAASSGSRGIYGAIAVAGAWGLPRGCAVAYTDKGAGTGYFDADSDTGVALDGTRAPRGSGLEFEPPAGAPAHTIAIKHAHSGDNPEADWGRHVMQAAEFALQALNEALPQERRFDFSTTRVIAVGLSNGGGAVLRAAEIDGGKLAGVVAIAPQVWTDAAGARSLYDYTTEAALLQPCALLDARFDAVALARPGGKPAPAALARCAALHERGLLTASDTAGQAAQAYAQLRAGGWSDAALAAAALSTSFDLWRLIGAGYASAYGRYSAGEMPCGYAYAALGPDHAPRATSAAERAAWASESGLPASPAIGLLDAQAAGADPTLPGLLCLRALWTGDDATAQRVRSGVAATRAGLPRAQLPVFVVHGADDGLVPEAFSSSPWIAAARAAGRDVRYWRVHNAQHFDAFLGLPPLAVRYVPLLPYAYRALDAMAAHVLEGKPLPGDAEIATTPRGVDGALPRALGAQNLGETPK